MENYPNRCYKIISNKYISKNRAYRESEFLDNLCKAGVSVPEPLCSIQTDRYDYLIMEAIDGITLGELIGKDQLDYLPESFDFQKFFDELKQNVKKMHTQNILHGDLHIGNIMISITDNKAKPVIIDFGDAVYTSDLDETGKYTNSKGEQVVVPNDDIKIGQAYKEFGEYLKKRGYFKKN